MNFVNTTAPIAIEQLKEYFVNKETFFIIDYKESELKGQKLLTYLSNLDLPVDLDNIDDELVKEYLTASSLVSIPSLEEIVTNILFEHKGITDTETYKEFISNNKEILDVWTSKLDSLTLFNMYTVPVDDFKTYVESFPVDETSSLEGINFISLIKHEPFFEWFKIVDEEKLVFYKTYFEEYMFKGKNLFSYWANENNPMFLLTSGIASGEVNSEEYLKAKEKSIEEMNHVAPI